MKRSFGAVFAGKSSEFFFRSWKHCYGNFNDVMQRAYRDGKNWLAEFDLVSFYELIDHSRLRKQLEAHVHNHDLLDLLFRCLGKWTTGPDVAHGVPQGPEPSAFLAECFLLQLDSLNFKHVRYLRYVDDIRLMAARESPLRRALVTLDLSTKRLGLVPQAQKLAIKQVMSIAELEKSIPSPLASQPWTSLGATVPQRRLRRLFQASMKKTNNQWGVVDETRFKFALARLKPRRQVLRRIAKLIRARPDLSWAIAAYFKKFPSDKEAADVLYGELRRDPTYDATAANYIDALGTCEPPSANSKYRRVVNSSQRRSAERSILLRVASLTFRGHRAGPRDAISLITREGDPRVRGVVFHRLFGDAPGAPYKMSDCAAALKKEVTGSDEDLARYSASLLLGQWPWFVKGSWRPDKNSHRAVKLLMLGLGLRARAPKRTGVIETFFRDRMKIFTPLSWRRALGSDGRHAERRVLRLLQLEVGDPSARVMMLDTLNEVLLHAFSNRHPQLVGAFRAAAGNDPHPDLGNWLNNASLARVLPKGIPWYKKVHQARVTSDLAHAKGKRGAHRGKATHPISFRTAASLVRQAYAPWQELIREWQPLV